MSEYISREAAIRKLRGEAIAKYPMSFANGLFAASDVIESIPAADVVEVRHEPYMALSTVEVVAVRHGHWYLDNGCAFCSECKNSFVPGIRSQALFCPRCGAKMDGDGE